MTTSLRPTSTTSGASSAVQEGVNNKPVATQSKYVKEMEFEWINNRLVGPDINAMCGLPETPKDCQPWYTVAHIEESVKYMDDNSEEIIPYAEEKLKRRAQEAALQCGPLDDSANAKEGVVLQRGGWCLQTKPKKRTGPQTISYQDITFEIPVYHVPPSGRIVMELSALIDRENITSINDFGAGVGQYKAAILEKHPNLDYRAYDGAGNAVQYTKGFLKYFDLTYPLGLPKADWVLSLEVGEHVPSKYEGMLIRNLHRHNRKGIILSWGVLGQGGHSHINNHANEYVINLMDSLGYTCDLELGAKMRLKEDNYGWFTKSVMVFRRKNPLP